MKKNNLKKALAVVISLSVISIGINAYAHSGRTDQNGGHKDNKNKSGLGSYHYHCGGYQAHLHTNGVCPYSDSSSSSKSTTSNSSSSSKKTSSKKTLTVSVTDIEINENIKSIEVGEKKILTATITPSNATDQKITWKSSDKSIATVSSEGEIIAKKSGTVEITVSSSNGKTSKIKINIKDKQKQENTNVMKTYTTSKDETNTTTNNIGTTQENSDSLDGVIMLGLLGGGTYWGYKKLKNRNN